MQWWCAARDVAWEWVWKPYPGVWLFMLALAAAHLSVRRVVRASGWEEMHATRRTLAFVTGLILLWAALDWPIGALGAGYLASAHMVQFLLIALASPPLLLLGLPRGTFHEITRGRAGRWIFAATHPLLALLVFNATVIATHLPVVTDTLMRSQLGSFTIDTLWFGAGLLYWWPVLAHVPERPRFTPPVKMAYLFASMVFMTAPGAMITFSNLPLYGIYELAPPIGIVSALDDQRIAGLLMKLGGGAITWSAITILFLRWNREEERLLVRDVRRVLEEADG
jgi:cytochrome c oxidase assembly factor CtaG